MPLRIDSIENYQQSTNDADLSHMQENFELSLIVNQVLKGLTETTQEVETRSAPE